MENNKIETHVKYDDRKKELTQYFKQTQEIKIGEDVIGEAITERKAIFKESGIRKIVGDLADQRMKLEQAIKKLKAGLKELPEMTKELKELEQKIQTINSFNKNKQIISQIETNESDLKIVKKDIRDIKETIGTRLKL